MTTSAGDFTSRLNVLFAARRTSLTQTCAHINAAGVGHISEAHLSHLLSGKRLNPSLQTLRALADYYQVDPAYFVSESDMDEKLRLLLHTVARLQDRDRLMVEAVLEAIITTATTPRHEPSAARAALSSSAAGD